MEDPPFPVSSKVEEQIGYKAWELRLQYLLASSQQILTCFITECRMVTSKRACSGNATEWRHGTWFFCVCLVFCRSLCAAARIEFKCDGTFRRTLLRFSHFSSPVVILHFLCFWFHEAIQRGFRNDKWGVLQMCVKVYSLFTGRSVSIGRTKFFILARNDGRSTIPRVI